MAMSILHRATGVFLGLGAVLLVLWLAAAASGPTAYHGMTAWLGGLLGELALFGWTFCFFYHLANGVRHLFWDIGRGFDLPQARVSGLTVIAVAVLMTIGFWMAVSGGAGAGS